MTGKFDGFTNYEVRLLRRLLLKEQAYYGNQLDHAAKDLLSETEVLMKLRRMQITQRGSQINRGIAYEPA